MSRAILTALGRQRIAGFASGGPVVSLTHFAVGDAGGAPYAEPNDAMTGLVGEKWRGPIGQVMATGAGRIVCRGALPPDQADGLGRPSHGFRLAEIGVFASDGSLFAVAALGNGLLPVPTEGVSESLVIEIAIDITNSAAVTVTFSTESQIAASALLRAMWITVSGVANAPPAGPALGDTWLVGPVPTGLWAGSAHHLAQWSGEAWVLTALPAGHLVCDASRDEGDPARFLKFTGGAWTTAAATAGAYGFWKEKAASEGAAGLARKATDAEAAGRAAVIAFVAPNQLPVAASEAAAGLVRKATAAEVDARAAVDAYVTPAALGNPGRILGRATITSSARGSFFGLDFTTILSGSYQKKSASSVIEIEAVATLTGTVSFVRLTAGGQAGPAFPVVTTATHAGPDAAAPHAFVARAKAALSGIGVGAMAWALQLGGFPGIPAANLVGDTIGFAAVINPNYAAGDLGVPLAQTATIITITEYEP